MKKNYLVTANFNETQPAEMKQILDAIDGVTVLQTMDAIGVLYIAADENSLPEVAKINGVKGVEPEGEAHTQ